jgi:hypothetical protein
MLPNAVIELGSAKGEYSNDAWQKSKTPIDKASKTGLGPYLDDLHKAYVAVKTDLMRLDAGMVGKLNGEEEIRAAKKAAQDMLNSSGVRKLIKAIDDAAKKADAVSKTKISSSAKKGAAKIATELSAMKDALSGQTFTDFDKKIAEQAKSHETQRGNFLASAKLLQATLKKLASAPVIETCRGTEFSGAFRNFQNKVGNLAEFRDIFDPRFDGMVIQHENLEKKTPEQVRQILLALVKDTTIYMEKVLKRAKEKGYYQ